MTLCRWTNCFSYLLITMITLCNTIKLLQAVNPSLIILPRLKCIYIYVITKVCLTGNGTFVKLILSQGLWCNNEKGSICRDENVIDVKLKKLKIAQLPTSFSKRYLLRALTTLDSNHFSFNCKLMDRGILQMAKW